jgi:hypothetical protein
MNDELKSVEAHNEAKKAERELWRQKMRKTGVACPKCNNELLWNEPPFTYYLGDFALVGRGASPYNSSSARRTAVCENKLCCHQENLET